MANVTHDDGYDGIAIWLYCHECICTADMCKIIFGSCLPEKHVAARGGGYNYCHGSLDVATTKDNYSVVSVVCGTDSIGVTCYACE